MVALSPEGHAYTPSFRRDRLTVREDKALSVQELQELKQHPIYRGEGVPHGIGEKVVIVPGFRQSNEFLEPSVQVLTRLGHKVKLIPAYDREINLLRQRDIRLIQDEIETTEEPFHLIGHSAGGVNGEFAVRRTAHRRGLLNQTAPFHETVLWQAEAEEDQRFPVKTLITVGSPRAVPGFFSRFELSQAISPEFFSLLASTPVNFATLWSSAYEDAVRTFMQGPEPSGYLPQSVNVVRIRSPKDAMVNPESAQGPDSTNIEVEGSHWGLIYNVKTLSHIAHALAEKKAA